MTSKLHCPFCGEEMKEETFYVNRKFYWCTNPKCDNDWGAGCSRQIVQALIDGKKAQDALKIVDGKLKVIANDENSSPIQSQALDCYIQIAKDCRDTITSITKQVE